MSLFRKMMGRTIKQHITDMRMFYAKMILSETDAKVLTVAMDSGFGSLSTFYEAFQKHVGISPAAFRRGSGKKCLSIGDLMISWDWDRNIHSVLHRHRCWSKFFSVN